MEAQKWELAMCCWFSTPKTLLAPSPVLGSGLGKSCALQRRISVGQGEQGLPEILCPCLLSFNYMERAAVFWESEP